jgi:PPE-repeat protein
MLAAAEAWESLAAELYSTASMYGSVISGLTAGSWQGASSSAMATAAATYVNWLSNTATQAQETAGQATAAAAAYEAAFAATVPPEVVAANRSLLMSLIATNLLGQNTPAIAATEAQYGEMWAQDVAAMFGYAGASASATQVTPFTPPQQTTQANAAASQASTVSQATAGASGTAQSTLSQLAEAFSAVPSALSNLGTTDVVGSLTPLDLFDYGADLIAYGLDAPMSPLGAISLPIDLVGAQTGIHTDDIVSGWGAAVPALAAADGAPLAETASSVTPSVASGAFGEANTVGGMSVPPTWTAATPAVRPIALVLPAAPVGAPLAAAASSSSLSDFALSSLAGRTMLDTFGSRGKEAGKEPAKVSGTRLAAPAVGTVAAAPAAAVDEEAAAPEEPRTVVTGIAAEIRDMARLRDEGLITDEQFAQQRSRLLGL